MARADQLARELGLRGYDAVHLASALVWQDGMGEQTTVATFDHRLWRAAGDGGFPGRTGGRAGSSEGMRGMEFPEGPAGDEVHVKGDLTADPKPTFRTFQTE